MHARTGRTATLKGMATAQGLPSTAWFEWGSESNFGQVTSPPAAGSGESVMRVSAPVGGLVFGGLDHYRLMVSNAARVLQGGEQLFTAPGLHQARKLNPAGRDLERFFGTSPSEWYFIGGCLNRNDYQI
ncbi:MAG: hypothetical protein ABSF95_10985, partial [Verrucomicrobiota bacterium]